MVLPRSLLPVVRLYCRSFRPISVRQWVDLFAEALSYTFKSSLSVQEKHGNTHKGGSYILTRVYVNFRNSFLASEAEDKRMVLCSVYSEKVHVPPPLGNCLLMCRTGLGTAKAEKASLRRFASVKPFDEKQFQLSRFSPSAALPVWGGCCHAALPRNQKLHMQN